MQAEEAEFAAAAMKPPSPQSLDPILCPSLQMLEWSFFGFVSGAWPLWGGGIRSVRNLGQPTKWAASTLNATLTTHSKDDEACEYDRDGRG